MYSVKENVNILTALLVRHGVRHVVVCPGSRNAPLVHNFNECPQIACHPATDERSAGFIALGLRQQLAEPVAVCVTSGSALLNLLPAVAEATYRHNGIIVISADRPEAWIGQLDGQTVPQPGAFGHFAPFSVNVPEPSDSISRWQCNRNVNEALIRNAMPAHPSVHINVPLTEPLFDFTVECLPDERKVDFLQWKDARSGKLLEERLSSSLRPMIVFGQVQGGVPDEITEALSARAVVLSEPISAAVRRFTDQMIYALKDVPAEYRPDVVIYLGGNTVSKRLRHFLRTACASACHICVSEDASLHDVSCNTSVLIEAEIPEFLDNLLTMNVDWAHSEAYRRLWNELRVRVEAAHSAFKPAYSQALAVKMLESRIKPSDVVHYANSMSVRLASIFANRYVWCNRGINGIEGSLSTAAGAALALSSAGDGEAVLYCVIGDLSFFYDQNALWQSQLAGNFRILLLNNGKGGIFNGLPGLESSPAAETLVAASHGHSAEGICRQFGLDYMSARNEEELECGIEGLCIKKSSRPVLLEVFTDAAKDNETYQEYYKHIAYGMEENV